MKLEMTLQQEHEHAGPTEPAETLFSPAWLAIAAAFAWSFCAVGAVHASPPAKDSAQRTTAALNRPTAARAGAARSDLDGGPIYSSRCAACHQSTGAGLSGVFPPLAGSEWVNGNEAMVVQVVLHGVQGALTVRGDQYNMSMPALGSRMSDAEVAAVATYVRSQWGNRASAVAPETVKRQRAASATRTAPWTEAELTKLR